MSTYAWVITRDLDNPYEPEKLGGGDEIPPRVGVSGPSDATDEQILIALTKGWFFRLVDDDSHVYYEGRMYSVNGRGSEDDFAPLDDYGRADVGAVDIQYREAGRWSTL